jgi:hypothetical protein
MHRASAPGTTSDSRQARASLIPKPRIWSKSVPKNTRMPLGFLLLLGLFLAAGVVVLMDPMGLSTSRFFPVVSGLGLFNVMLGFLVVATLFAITEPGERRICWLGFGLFAWAYLILGVYLHSDVPTPMIGIDTALLPDTILINFVAPNTPAGQSARTIVHAMFTLVAGVGGYFIASWLARRNPRGSAVEDSRVLSEPARGSVVDRAHGSAQAPSPETTPAPVKKERGIKLSEFMWLVPLLAAGLTALRFPSDLWSSSLLSLTIVVLATSTLAGIAGRSANRLAWAGFAAFGWIYLFLGEYLEVSQRWVSGISAMFIPGKIATGFVALGPFAAYERTIIHSMLALIAGLIGYLAVILMTNRKAKENRGLEESARPASGATG